MDTIKYFRDIPVTAETDVIVCGAGCAGIAAAIASARNGARTMLIERNGIVGGSATVGLVGPFMTCYSRDHKIQIIKGIFDEFVRNMVKLGGAIHPSEITETGTALSGYYPDTARDTPFEVETYIQVAIEMLQQAGVKLCLYTTAVDSIVENGKITGIIVNNKSGMQAYKAKIMIDCTGDGDIAALSGAEFMKGREEDGLLQPMTLFFIMNGINDDAIEAHVRSHPDEMGMLFYPEVEQAKRVDEFPNTRCKVGMYRMPGKGMWRFNCTRIQMLNPTNNDQLVQAELEGRRQVAGLIRFFKKYLPGFENAQLYQVGSQIGIRESRRIRGEYELVLEDLLNATHFEDAIALCSYEVDIHLPKGEEVKKSRISMRNFYEIPYRILVPAKMNGLLAAGRCSGMI